MFLLLFFFQIKRGHVWLEGDNKNNSSDSRNYGQVPYGLLRGRVFFVASVVLSLGGSKTNMFFSCISHLELWVG